METLACLLSLSLLIVPTQTSQSKQPKNTSAMAQHYGHGTPPITPMKGMDGESFSIEPLKGRWTLLYFWADWCVPCVEEGIPSLTSFVNKHSTDRAAYSIVAIRFNRPEEPGDWNTFHEKTELLEKTAWHGVPPFPIVYDATTRMTVDWGVHALPTFALINPDGNLVRKGSLSALESALKRQVNKPE